MHRYSRLGYVALSVSDLPRSRRFYQDVWGLMPNGSGAAGEQFFRCSNDHHNLVLHQGEPGIKRIAWQMESEGDLGKIAQTLGGLGLRVQETPLAECLALKQGRTLRFSCPFTGVTHEYFVTMERADGVSWLPEMAKIQRIGHVVLKTPRYQEAVEFYLNVLNFRVSDAIGTNISFMRCFPNPLHHSLGLANAPKAGLHHLNFMVSEVDDIGKALWRFKKNDVPIVRGPGRHPPSGSMFLYALDPDGLTMEYSFGMEEFPEVNPRAHRVLPLCPESIDSWGGPTDARLGAVGAVEHALE